MSRQIVDQPFHHTISNAAVAIAVPARDEAISIEACLHALDISAANVAGVNVDLVLLVNNSSDATAEIAADFRPTAMRITVLEVALPPSRAHAGGARRDALERAAALLPPDGVLMTTDADSRVDPNWIAANLAELAAGVDAVAGVVAFDDLARASLPPMPLRALEWRLAGLHARLGSLIDPLAHDPWPNHVWAWGASLALTKAAYQQVGGLPPVPLAEDRALAEAIERHDLRLRRSHAPVVFTSPRKHGRAPGGLADLLQSYLADADTPCDAALEPVAVLLRRLCWRARLRRTAEHRGLAVAAGVARRIGYNGAPASGFGALWSAVEAKSSMLARARVDPSILTAEVALATRAIKRIEQRAVGRADIAASALAA